MPRASHLVATMMTLAALLGGAAPARAQCMLANPSFEVAGSSGNVFGGWSQFGAVSWGSSVVHGARVARVTGPGSDWGVSGYWQPLDCVAGQRWDVSVVVTHSAASPLTGSSRAIVNLEWRDAGGNLISYESHEVATPSSPTDAYRIASFQSGAAPTGTAKVRLLLGVLEGAGEPSPVVSYDLATCVLSSPTPESYQWGDFPTGRTVTFSGRTWRVKGTGYYGPGPNWFSSDPASVWVDASDRLHLTIRKSGAVWYSSEVALPELLGYGDYVFTTRGRMDLLDRNAVFGLFIWEYGPCYDNAYVWWNPYNEIDIEFSRWGNASLDLGQFVAQPAASGDVYRFPLTLAVDEVTSHAMRWLPDRVEYRSWRGGPDAEATSTPIASWTYTGPHLPRPGIPRVHLNLWQLAAPTVLQEVVLDAFRFVPICPDPPCNVASVGSAPDAKAALSLAPAMPNPTGGRTRVAFTVATAGTVELAVYDLAGRRVRGLASGWFVPGGHAVEWDGRDDGGARVAPGVYLIRARGAGDAAARRVVVLG